MSQNLKDVSTHFAFGRNWSEYATLIDETRIAEAEKGLLRLIPQQEIAGRSLLDIGCGSGLHALAALRLGARHVTGLDIDADSVATTRATLAHSAPDLAADIRHLSVFDATPDDPGTFDIVYSWGVLHHTGAMWEGVERAAALVAPGGLLALALYRKTALCPLWRVEKKWYTRATPRAQAAARAVYKALFAIGLAGSLRSYTRYVQDYHSARGMHFDHDVHDWMGGYPYESVTPDDIDKRLTALGFQKERVFARRQIVGFFGSGCDEFVYRRI